MKPIEADKHEIVMTFHGGEKAPPVAPPDGRGWWLVGTGVEPENEVSNGGVWLVWARKKADAETEATK